MGDIQERTYRIFFSRIRTGEDDQGREKERSFRIWPFFDYEREETGRETFNLFYLFPFKEEGLERNLFPLFRIFQWEKDPQKGISTNLFWGFYKKVKREGLDYWEIAHLIGLKRGQGWKKVSFLKGLLLYQTEGETASLRFFYLPFHLRWSRYDSSASSLAEGRREKAETIFSQLQGEREDFTPAEKELVDER
jgi:hypothetical protein